MPVVDHGKGPQWIPGRVENGTFIPVELQGEIDDKTGEYTPSEEMLEREKNNLGRRHAGMAIKDASRIQAQEETPKDRRESPSLVRAFRIVSLCVAALSSLVSAWFNFGYRATVLPVPIAALLSAIVVLSATLGPEMVILCWRRRRWFLAIVVGTVGAVASLYSMTTTVAGQYNARAAQAIAAMEEERNDDDRRRIIAEIDMVNGSIRTYQKRIDRATDAGKTDASATTLKKQDEARKAELERLLNVSSMGRKDRQDFYAWLDGLVGAPKGFSELCASTLPAILLDLAAPVFAVIFLVL